MPLANLIAGQPFKVAIRALLVFILVYALASVLLVRAVQNTLNAELKAQATAEALLLKEIYERDGATAVLETLKQMERAIQPTERVASLFDEAGLTLTGPISAIPDFVGVVRREIRTLTGGKVSGEYVLSARKLGAMTLVVGRNGRLERVATRRMVIGLTVFGAFVVAAILSLGLWASRTSLRRLEDMDDALRRVSRGDINARLPVLGRNDQFDRVSFRMNQNLDQLSRLMGGMKSTALAIAHDLKTPLSHTQISLHEAADAARAGQDSLPKIETALGEVEALNLVFETMLRITRIQSNADPGRVEPIDMRALVSDVVEFMLPFAEEQSQILYGEAQGVHVSGDAPMLTQALVNLVKNASVHGGEGVTIGVSARREENGVCLTVQDDGPGIPADQRENALEPFVRMDGARTTPGSGLGLALVRAVAEYHGAALKLSDAQPGLKVELLFPKFKNV